MNGRLEGELRLHNETLKLLETLPEYVTNWYNQMRASKKTASTRKDFVYKIKKYLQSINTNTKIVDINQLTNASIVNYMMSIETKTDKNGNVTSTSGSYQKTIWAAMNSFFQYLEDEDIIEKNYMKRIGKSRKNDSARVEKKRILLTKKDFNKILEYVKNETNNKRHSGLLNRDMAMLLIFMCTGIRVTALTQINIEDIDFKNKTLMVIDKEDADRECILTDITINYIKEWIKDRKKYVNEYSGQALFITEHGKRVVSVVIRQMLRNITKHALGYEISPHKLRAGFCSILYKDTKDIELVRRTVGHSSSVTTQRYIVMGKEDKLKVANSINQIGA